MDRIPITVRIHPKDLDIARRFTQEDLGDILSDGMHFWQQQQQKSMPSRRFNPWWMVFAAGVFLMFIVGIWIGMAFA